jgi:rhodanese-related sulfurtransferase
MPIEHIGNPELTALLEADPSVRVLDVRTPEEYTHLGHLPQATLLPLHTLPTSYQSLDPLQKTVVLCQHGVRSLDACLYLEQLGFQHLYNLTHGMAAWDGPVEREPFPKQAN